ncbi:MAG: Dynamin- GTPase protein, partial [Watsoniomyces obsoletus]
MSSVIQSKNEKEKKFAQLEEKRRRDKSRMKQLGVNGTATPEEGDEEHEDKPTNLPLRQHQKNSRSMSPAMGRDRENGSMA